RHIKRIDEIRELADRNGFEHVMWSEMDAPVAPGKLVLVDTVGELFSIYSLATVAVVGGSFVPAGGHNIVEAAVWGVPVISGAYYSNFKNIVESYIEEGGLIIAKNEKELYNNAVELLESSEKRTMLGERNIRLTEKMKAAIENNISGIL
ncbi:3-deoxy-D-manno-octulosonic acid transferase, partial [Elusimicrobiota bacterium]